MENSEQYIVVKQNDFRDILEAAYRCWALEGGGVDNWIWYSDSIYDWINTYNTENHTNFEGISDMVDDDIQNVYETLEEHLGRG